MSELGAERAYTSASGRSAVRAKAGIPFRARNRVYRPTATSKAAVRYVRATSVRGVGAPVGAAAKPHALRRSCDRKSLSGEFYAGVGIATMFTRSEFQVRTACGNCA